MQGTCKSCKKWDRHQHICNLVDWLDDVAYDASMPYGTFGIFAEAHDDQGLMAALKTGPDFGCVQYTRKEATQ